MDNIVYIKIGFKMSVFKNNLKVESDKGTQLIPFSAINTIMIENIAVVMTAAVNVSCGEYNIPIIYCNKKYIPVCESTPLNGYYQQLPRLQQQYKWSNKRKQKIFKAIVFAKLTNQLELLMYLDRDDVVILNFKQKIRELTDLNAEYTEAVCAKIYFKALYGKNFKRFKDDDINTSMNYGYAILRSKIKQIIVAHGLAPSIGIWHHSVYNNFNLADDIIEVYRPMVDFVAFHLSIKGEKFSKESRIYLQNVIFQKVYCGDHQYEFTQSVEMFVVELIKYMNRETKKMTIPRLDSNQYVY